MTTLWSKLMTGLRAFREAFLSAGTLPTESGDFSAFEARRVRYELLWAFYENTAYRTIHRWAAAYKAQFGLYKYIRNLYNPAFRLAEFWKTHLWGGPLDPAAGDGDIIPSALPISTDNPALRPALAQIWQWSNWPIRKDVITLWGSVLGDVALRVVDDTTRSKVYLAALHPGTLADVTLDPYNNVKSYTIQELRPSPPSSPLSRSYGRGAGGEGQAGGGGLCTYTETAERGPGDDVIFRTYLDGSPFPWNGVTAEWVEPYGFIPLVLIRHNDVGLDWGWSELHPARSKIQEIDDLASLLSDQIRKSINASWILAGLDRPKTAPSASGAPPSATLPEPGREELTVFYSADPSARAIPLVAPLDITGVIAHIAALLAELERDYPELRFDNLRVSGQVSGATLRVARQPVETKVNQRRAIYDDALVRAHNMAVAIAGLRRLPGFEPFDLRSYARGDLHHSIALRPVFDVDPMDRLDEQRAFWETANLARQAGVPLKTYLAREGWDPDDLAALPDPPPPPPPPSPSEGEGRGEGEMPNKEPTQP